MLESTGHALGKFAAGLVAIAVGGCASVPRVEMERSSATRIEKVALLRVPAAPTPSVTNSSGVAAAFGMLGALVQAGTNASHGAKYAAVVADRSAALAPRMTAALADALATAGYRVALADDEAKVVHDGDDVDVSAVHTDADAILAVWFTTVGYYSPAGSPAYQPWVIAKARLIDTKSRADLYFKTFSSGAESPVQNAVYVPSAESYRYGSFGDLMAEAPRSAEAFDEAAQAIVFKMRDDLSRQ